MSGLIVSSVYGTGGKQSISFPDFVEYISKVSVKRLLRRQWASTFQYGKLYVFFIIPSR